MKGGQAVVEQLENEDVEVVFGIPGVHTLEIYDTLRDSDIKHVTTRHEQGAGFMADGYARASGRVGVVLVITGPGLTNAATPIAQAYSDSIPMLVISSRNPTNEAGRGKGHLHELKDQQSVMENIAAYSENVERVSDIPDAIADAFSYLQSHRPRPIHIQIPTDVLERDEPVETTTPHDPSFPKPDQVRIDAAVERLREADRPLLFLGGGATDAAAEAQRFVDLANIPVVSSTPGKGIVSDEHDLNLGAALGRESIDQFVSSRDLMIAVGTEFSPRDTGNAEFPHELVHIDIDYENFGRNHPTTLGIVGDASRTLQKISFKVEEQGIEFDAAIRNEIRDLKDEHLTLDPDSDGQHRILSVLRETLAEDAIVVNDMTKLCYTARRLFPMNTPGNFLFPRGYGTLGFSPPTAFGAAVGVPDRQVVALVGDGGFLFTLQELATAVKYNLSVPIIVLNDEAYGVIEDKQREQYGRSHGAEITNPEFVDLARSFGASAHRIEFESLESELPTVLSESFERSGPTLIEIPVDF